MVRKKLGDLLREEAKEPVAREDAPVKAEDNAEVHNEEVKEELPPVNIPATKSRRSTATTTEAETTVDELKKLFQTAQKTESSLEAQITDLKSQLQEQKKLTKETTTEAETIVGELKKLLQTAQKTESSLEAQITDLKSQLQEQKKLMKETTTEEETTVDELKKLFQTAQKTESSLEAQITDLKSQLQEQKKLMKELQTQGTHEKQLKTELEEAKKTILKLAEVSSKPPAKASPAKKESNLALSKSTRTERLPNYSDPSERPNTTLANKDIGWFD